MKSLFIRNLIFTILQPGVVVILIPFLLIGNKFKQVLNLPFTIWQSIGLILFLLGWSLIIFCIYRFAVEGQGTLSPADPTKKLVIKGIYQYSRNPMYIGVMLALTGEVFFVFNNTILIYMIIIFTMFNLFVIFVEEPRLKRDFGEQYLSYCSKVQRWF